MSEAGHNCDAFVLMCMDFRFHELVISALKETGIASLDLKCDAGAVKYLVSTEKPGVRDWILQNIEISKNLHHINTVVLVNHYDCGAYGGSAAFDSDQSQMDFHRQQLADARELVSSRFPDLKVKTLFAKLEGGKATLQEL